ncbi:MAG: hypothetical protein ABSC41_09880 [Acidimicrobiales bacterium]
MSTPEPQRLINARRFFLSYSKEHVDEAVQLLSPHVEYSVPGNSLISGVFRGPDEVRQHIIKLIDFSRGTFEVYAQAQSDRRIYRGHHIYLLEFDPDDLLSVIKVFFEDQASADRFFAYDS